MKLVIVCGIAWRGNKAMGLRRMGLETGDRLRNDRANGLKNVRSKCDKIGATRYLGLIGRSCKGGWGGQHLFQGKTEEKDIGWHIAH